MPLIHNNTVYIARDNGSLSAYDQTNGTLKWLTIISSRSGRNDLESQRDAEMNILVSNNRLFYGHFQGEIAALDLATGDIVWSSPLSFVNNISIHGSSILGSTTSNVLISLDKASGFVNWKNELNKDITEPFIIDKIVMIFSTDGTLGQNSNNKVPTQAAVKTYVDTEVANVDKLIEGNTTIETIDSGTNGHIQFKVDNNLKLEIDNGGNTIPGADNASNLGSSTKRWANIYAADMHYSNKGDKNSVDGTWGSYTIQEGESDLFLLNNRNGKKYKFNLTEVN